MDNPTFKVGNRVWVIDSDDVNYHCVGDIIELGNNLGLPHDREYRVAIELAESGEHWTEPTWYRVGQIQIAPGEKHMSADTDTAQAVIEAARALLNPDIHPTSRAMVKAMQNLRAALDAHDEATGEDA